MEMALRSGAHAGRFVQSGSAAAVANHMVPFAIGTQTNGSTIRPASFCGVFGYRPSYGDLRCTGVKEAAGTLDTLGLFATSTRRRRESRRP